ncbi:PREDICTED: heat shock 70 kDa protein 12A-like [Amphimedon queenslandica]|uniref:Uncharacterized protein n=1 Tax=Amphimedon queenslandica TaxID=400682 RepID=A0A1X7TS24_AMPQE|nr:PREDICTED: heat shock 70 kDa protein 12A-like [Amphimedon queenslandica]XP_019858061.1 PREDICTED: heat shock 70 kDa protein 12A-like [Amphimedon queenslandica]|eukprot:XP_011406944.1 PREDICTED: heat shock 70 kDa protein 12A-like [Amphimedon queenslandica]
MALAASGGYFAFGIRRIEIFQIGLRKPNYKPPLSRAKKIPRTDTGYRVTDGNIAAIDFGTTSVSLAYTTKGDDEITNLRLDEEDQAYRVPNAVLLKKEGRTITVQAFGNDARTQFTQMRKSGEYIYFERIKMLMKREENVDRNMLVESFSGEKFYLVEVIAFILKYLKNELMKKFSETARPLKTTDFDWVITVPAIWNARGKRMMREAAYLAGLMTGYDGISSFTSAALSVPREINPDRLSLALEPEAAALYSQEKVGDQIDVDPATAVIKRPSDYMVIDAGGGTIDITAQIEVDGNIIVENIPTGNAWGGTKINEAFSQLLQHIVGDSEFKSFLKPEQKSQCKATLNKILYVDFEKQKVLLGNQKSTEVAVALPAMFVRHYKEALTKVAKKENGVEYDEYTNDTLYIEKEVAESRFFGPAIKGIIDCTLKAIEENGYKVRTFYLVGGFGGCKYVHKKVKAAIEKAYSSKGCSCDVIVPLSPQLAVAQGAVMWRKNPEKIKARRSDATYGINVSIPFDDDEHDEYYKFYNEEQKQDKCDYVFSVFLEKGELVQADQVITISLTPAYQSSKQITIGIYSTPNLGVRYIIDTNGKSTVTKIGQLVIDIPNPDDVPRNERHVDVTMDFSGTEIQAKAKYRITGEEVKTVCDFLSAQ